MSKYEQYAALTATKANDLLLAVDVNDTSMSPQGTTKKISLAALGNNIQTKNANYTVTTNDYIVFGDTSLGNVTFTLPDATTCTGQTFIFKIINSANTLLFATVGGQTIDGAPPGSWALGATLNSGYEVVSNGSNWEVINTFGQEGALTVSGLSVFQSGIQTAKSVVVTSNYGPNNTDYIILCNGASSAISISLPDASFSLGQVYLIKVTNAANATTLTPYAGQTVNGFGAYTMNHAGWTAYIVADGVSNWNVFAAMGFTDNNILDDSSGAAFFSGPVQLSAGSDTSAVAGFFNPAPTSGTAFQPSTQSDIMLYCNIKIASTFSLSIGSTSAASNAIVASGTAAIGLVTVRVPKNWWAKSTFTAADVAWTASRV